jgi:predicted amidohydrolase YtcJ
VLLTNGRVYTMDAAGRVVDSLLVRDGRVLFAGRRADVNPGAGEPVVEAEAGSLEPGKRTDLVALSADVFRCPEAAIKDIPPVLTMVGGQVVASREP